MSFPEALSASKKGTFAYVTIKDRLPVTITKAIDYLSRFRNELIKRYSEEASEDIKNAIDRLSQLRYELTTDKPFRKVIDLGEDAELWNQAYENLKLEIGEEKCTWFKGPWLFAECYMYRRIRESMLLCNTNLKYYDPFEYSKLDTHEQSFHSVCQLITSLCPLDFEQEKTNPELAQKRFKICLEALLWANKNDLSLSSGNDVSSKVKNLIDLLESFKPNILCDHSDQLWEFFKSLKQNSDSKPVHIDIVLDNCSIELASDLIFCDFLLRNKLVDRITLHAKAYSWFISDVTKDDFEYLIRQLKSSNSLIINNFIQRLGNNMNQLKIVFEHIHPFWTSPYSFDKMNHIYPDLYSHFSKSSFIMFKGDLNYRKLIGDLNWPFETKLKNALRGFRPTNLCAIRTLKSDLVANLDLNDKKFRNCLQKFGDSNNWMITGDYGLIQFGKLDE